jgi:peptidoglycan/xylan/chitin deacetylase (PgdA/CDA1 family)
LADSSSSLRLGRSFVPSCPAFRGGAAPACERRAALTRAGRGTGPPRGGAGDVREAEAALIPDGTERRARWVLETLGARAAVLGEDVPYRPEAWAAVERGERPDGDELADAFFHLARVEEWGASGGNGRLDAHGRFPGAASCLDPLDPPLERLRASLGLEPPRWGGGRFAVALTHDVDVPWRWTRAGVRAGAGRVKAALARRRVGAALAETRALAAAPVHAVRRTDPWWSFERVTAGEAEAGVRSTFFVMAGHAHRADGPAPGAYERLRPRLVETLREGGAEIGLHGSYRAADERDRLDEEKRRLEALAGPVGGQRYHYLRVRPDRNLAPLAGLGFAYDSTLGFADRIGFRAGIAHPFRPWDPVADRPARLVEIPLAIMDVTLGEERYLGLTAEAAERRILELLDWAADAGGGFALLWHSAWYDDASFPGWGALYFRIIQAVEERGGVCLSGGELATEAAEWLG